MKPAKLFFVLLLSILVSSAYAHFQLVYTPTSVIPNDATSVEFKLVFTHPFESGLTMDIGKDESGTVKGMQTFFAIHKGKKTNLLPGLSDLQFTSHENSGKGFQFILDKGYGFRGGGDWVLVAVPHPYYESADDMYIRQITKVIINKGALATDWTNRVAEGYPEILPLVKPYDVWAGGIFRGIVVDGKGKPVPYAEIEFEYINYDIDMAANKFTGSAKLEKSGAGIILANQQGVFEFIPPRAGYWGFAALGAGGEKQFGGKKLSEDAVLWIEAQALELSTAMKETGTQSPEAQSTPTQRRKKSGLSNIIVIIVVILILTAVISFIVLRKKKNQVN